MKQAHSPVIIATWRFGKEAVEHAGELLRNGHSVLDAVEKGINVVELEPAEKSVGFGGRPNADGVVELDAAIMHGPTHDAGAVAGLRHIKRPISVARLVMEKTPHAMLVGDGALQFAIQQGFQQEHLLTDESRDQWKTWLENRQSADDSHDTIGLAALDTQGDLAAGCSTSGIGYKLPGRVGDSPLVGSGLYVDNDVGAASATGLGEEILKFCSSFLVVELMRQGLSPQEACEQTIRRILAKKPQNKDIQIGLIALSHTGKTGAAACRPGFQYAVWREDHAELSDAVIVASIQQPQ